MERHHMKKTKRMYMIGNAHIDPVWLWQWQEGFQEVKATFRSALDRMNEYDDFIFTSSSAAFYEWVELNDKAMFQEIQKRIEEGRWFLAGGWWVQSDCNIPSGESFVRQALVGQRYFLEKFGKIATYGYNVDSFGHHGMLPQILAKSGCTSYVFMRPMPLEKALPARTFTWEASDGSRVQAYRLPYEYLSWKDDLYEHVLRCADEIKAPLSLGMCFYGVGNHGGGPTKANIESIRELQKHAMLPELLFSTPQAFFSAVEKSSVRLPVHHGDLQHHASGCYAAHSEVKRLNRLAENRLLASEKYSSVAAILGTQSYPKDFIHAWKQVLFNQFHDTLAGTSLREAYDDAAFQYGEAISIADRNMNYALQSISWAIDIKAEENLHPLVVFNPHSWEVTSSVHLEFGKVDDSYKLYDEENGEIPFQVVRSSSAARGRNRLVFVPTVPALGYRVYRLLKRGVGTDLKPNNVQLHQQAEKETSLKGATHTLENEHLLVSFDKETGCIE
ncbi:MAG: alpha-mannosidase, partial [Spirochaetia bacterium]|nr:alpha-mannosidase [Spirochaetia bacterium]